MRIDHSAGGIVIRRQGNQVLFLLIKDSYGNWSFPKGGIEGGETPLQAAQREIGEEVGLTDLKPIRSLGRVEFWFKDKWKDPGQKVKKFVEYFLLEDFGNQRVRPQQEEGILGAEWVTAEESLNRLSYKNLKAITERACEAVK